MDCKGLLAIVDNDPMVLRLLRSELRKALPQCPVIWTEENGTLAVARTQNPATCPDLLLLDMSLAGIQGPTVCRQIRISGSKPAVLAITSFSLSYYAERIADAGAQGIIAKHASMQDIARAITDILDPNIGHYANTEVDVPFETAAAAHARVKLAKPSGLALLTPAESQVVDMAAHGESSQRIAATLGKSKGTVDTLFRRAIDKTKSNGRLDLILAWLRERGGEQ
ncbi:DNA-binding response regulator [Bifidobacterium biavatii]|uniref:Two component transcriptional regulator, LuxR family n=1 Tax=Bifidobacterium biavatii DSM 23969 TaxID=1437608 RepID=A0A086ZNK9_9BIFI|nr:response regulator transcription factor [Bifidobacterium biavatii]KFI48109.1 two component transcriptional regulator, LuxR family [Bifidobacterium biavatii DSM 23969]